MKIRTDFVTNSSSSSYVLEKRLVVDDTDGPKVPIVVSHMIDSEYDDLFYWVNGSYSIKHEILDECFNAGDNDDLEETKIDNTLLATYAADFWDNGEKVISRFYKDSNWRVEEDNRVLAEEHMNKYSFFGVKYAELWQKYIADGRIAETDEYYIYYAQLLQMYHEISRQYIDGCSISSYSVRDKNRFSYFNKYVKCINVYLYNTEYKNRLLADIDCIFRVAGEMLAISFEQAAKIAEKLRGSNLLPIFVGELPRPDGFPTVPSDIWLLSWSLDTEYVEDMHSIELSELEAWLETYTRPAPSGSYWMELKKFIEQHAGGKVFYSTESRYDTDLLYKQYCDGNLIAKLQPKNESTRVFPKIDCVAEEAQLLVKDGIFSKVPIQVSHQVRIKDEVPYMIDGSYHVEHEILKECMDSTCGYVDPDYINPSADYIEPLKKKIKNALLAKYAADFWANGTNIMAQFYNDASEQIESISLDDYNIDLDIDFDIDLIELDEDLEYDFETYVESDDYKSIKQKREEEMLKKHEDRLESLKSLDKWELLAVSCADLNLSTLSECDLQGNGMYTIGDVVVKTKDEFCRIFKGEGLPAFVVRAIESLGLKFAMYSDTEQYD